MASLREIKDHIASVRSTLKITSAMKLVSSAKLRKAQQAVESMRAYQRELDKILVEVNGLSDSDLLKVDSRDGGNRVSVKDCGSAAYPPPCGRVAIVAIASNSSLCGAFNANVLRKVREMVDEIGADKVDVYAIGRKLAEPLSKGGAGFAPDILRRHARGLLKESFGSANPLDWQVALNALVNHPQYSEAQELADSLLSTYSDGDYSDILLVYNHFVSTASQKVVVESLLNAGGEGSGSYSFPKAGFPEAGAASENICHPRQDKRGDHEVVGSSEARLFSEAAPASDKYILEPGREQIIAAMIPQLRRLKLYAAILDSVASEHAARMIAMQAATDNAEDLLAELSLEYNKGRQAKITSEILDLVAGSRN